MTDASRHIPVQLMNPEDIVFRTEETEPQHFSFTTFTLTPGQQAQTILAQDPLRKSAAILPVDAGIVLCDSTAQAMSPRNQDTGLPSPDGAYVPQGAAIALTGTGQAWAACAAPTRVSVIINRRNSLWGCDSGVFPACPPQQVHLFPEM